MESGLLLRECRLMAGFTQEEVGRRLGVGASAINKWETGATDMPVSYVFKLASIYRIRPGDLFGPPADPGEDKVSTIKVMARLADVHPGALLVSGRAYRDLDRARELTRGFELTEKLPSDFRQRWCDIGELHLIALESKDAPHDQPPQ